MLNVFLVVYRMPPMVHERGRKYVVTETAEEAITGLRKTLPQAVVVLVERVNGFGEGVIVFDAQQRA